MQELQKKTCVNSYSASITKKITSTHRVCFNKTCSALFFFEKPCSANWNGL